MPFGPYWNELPQAGGKYYVDQAAWNQVIDNFVNWKGDINGGGFKLSNVILEGSGGFEFLPSPVKVTVGPDGESLTVYMAPGSPDPVYRWTSGKDSTPETGANAGSNFAIVRYDDAGSPLGTPLSINRASGIISMGQQLWAANVDGGGRTLSNVAITGYATDPTTSKGDLIARSATVLVRVPIGSDGQVLTADAASGAGVKWSAPVGGVPPSRRINTTVPLIGGADLSTDLTLGISDATAASKGVVQPDGTTIVISGGVITAIGGGGGSGVTWGSITGTLSAQADLGVALDARLRWRGAWGASTVYAVNDVALYGGRAWRRKTATPPLTPTHVQSKILATGSLAFASNVTAGNVLLVVWAQYNTSVPGTPTDTLGTTYTQVAAEVSFAGYPFRIFKGIAPISGACTVTISGGSPDLIGISEYSGLGNPTVEAIYTSHGAGPVTWSPTLAGSPGVIWFAALGYSTSLSVSGGITRANDGTSLFLQETPVPTPGAYSIGATASGGFGYAFSGFGAVALIAAATSAGSPDTEPTNWDALSGDIDAKLDDSQLDTDTALAANSDAKIASQKAVKAYVDAHAGGGGGSQTPWTSDIDAAGFRLMNTGNVGIGTTNPLDKLNLVGGGIRIATDEGGNNGQHYAIARDGAGNGLLVFYGAQANFSGYGFDYTNNSSVRTRALTIQNVNGNVGIGTASPQDLLQIDSAIGWGVRIRYTGDGSYTRLSSNGIQAYTSAAAVSALLLNSSGGNVGIGTASPQAPLHVKGGSELLRLETTSTVSGGGVGYLTLWDASASRRILMGFQGAVSRFDFLNDAPGGAFYFANPVGIAMAPAYALDVNGTVRATNFIGGGLGGGVSTQNVVTGSRAAGTTYQNTTGKPMFVWVSGPANSGNLVSGQSDSSSNPLTSVATMQATGGGTQTVAVSFWVLPNNYYKAIGFNSISQWTEWT